MPSMPWGSSRTMPFCLTHLACPGQMNWSIMHWAVLWKSPNWASQSTRALGLAMAKPSSKPVGGRGGGGGGHLPGAPPTARPWGWVRSSPLTKDAVLGQGAVADGVGSLVRPQVVHGDAGPLVHVLVVQDVVAMAGREDSTSPPSPRQTQAAASSGLYPSQFPLPGSWHQLLDALSWISFANEGSKWPKKTHKNKIKQDKARTTWDPFQKAVIAWWG